MIRKTISAVLAAAALAGFTACENDPRPTPSNADSDRLPGLLDLSKPLVKEFKENYDVNILYRFNDTLDFKFQMKPITANDRLNKITISHLEGDQVDYALREFEEGVLACFGPDFLRLLPKNILLADEINLNGTPNPDNFMPESDYIEEGTATIVGTDYAHLIGFNRASIEALDPEVKLLLRNVKLYCLICAVMERHDLYRDIPADFSAEVRHLYKQDVDTLAMHENAPMDEGRQHYLATWYTSKGMALTKRSPNFLGDGSHATRLVHNNMRYHLFFPDERRDFRNFLSLVIFETRYNLTENKAIGYCDSKIFRSRMKIAIETLNRWGVHVERINPGLTTQSFE